jgi:Phage integrase, N-terminal SAM-like domain
MLSARDCRIIELWLQRQASPHTRGCYRRDAARLRDHAPKPLSRLTLNDLQGFAQSLEDAGLAPISCASAPSAALFSFANTFRR